MANCLPAVLLYGWTREEEEPEVPDPNNAPFTLEFEAFEESNRRYKARLIASRRPGFTSLQIETVRVNGENDEFLGNLVDVWQGDEETPSTNALYFTVVEPFEQGVTYKFRAYAPVTAPWQEEHSNILTLTTPQ